MIPKIRTFYSTLAQQLKSFVDTGWALGKYKVFLCVTLVSNIEVHPNLTQSHLDVSQYQLTI